MIVHRSTSGKVPAPGLFPTTGHLAMTAGTSLRAAGVIISACILSSCSDGPTDVAGTQEAVGISDGELSSAGGGQSSEARGANAPRFIVTLAEREDPRAVAAQYGIEPNRVYTHVLNGFAGGLSAAARDGLLRDARVVAIDKDTQVRLQDSPQLDAPWGLDRIDQREGALDGSYAYGSTGAGVTAYIIDSGIRYSHTDFAGRARPGFDAFGEDGSDCFGHGTHVAGTVGGTTYGVAKGVALVSVRVINCDGWGSGSDLIAAMDWIMANRHGPAVANMSLAFYVTSNPRQSPFDRAVENLISSGVTVVAAAANYGADACDYSPARVPEAITVGSTDARDRRSSFSNFGRCVDWFAPGENIVSASYASDDGAAYKSGTSMSAPHTAGVAALFLDTSPNASPGEVADTLLAWTTKSVVENANSSNDHLLYSPAAAHGDTPSNQPPSASFVYACDGLVCLFGDRSSDADGTIVSRSWSFGSSGSSEEANPSFTFDAAGTYAVSLRVVDDEGAASSAEQNVTVTETSPANQPPTAGFSFTCQNLTCQFTDESGDPDGAVVAWSWSFDSNAQAAEPNPSHVFPDAGTYTVSLTVVDDGGATATAGQDVTVTAPPPPTTGIQLTASGSKNKGLHAVLLEWTGASGSKVDLYRDGDRVAAVSNSGTYLDALSSRGKAVYRYMICETASATCSEEVEVTF